MLTLSSFTGPFGVLAAAGEPGEAETPQPIFRAVQGLAALAGHTQVVARVSDDRVAALTGRSPAGAVTAWLANLTADDVPVDASAFAGSVTIWDGAGVRRVAPGEALARLTMPAYAIARIG
ncbi:MAG: hypothetical protein E5X69_11445 [Mesorhizobium sp.]|nr:MAG: hypothetical protein E5X69_11445 [Mesorhizobium sp.]